MSNEEKNEVVDTQETVEQKSEETTPNVEEKNVENNTGEDLDVLKKKVATLEAQKEHWREKAKNVDEKPQEDKGSDKYTSLLLRTEGFKTKEEQEVFLSVAEKTGEEIDVLIQDDYLLAKVEKLREKKKTEAATPSSSSKRSAENPADNMERLVKKLKEKGEMPKDRETREKMFNYIKQNG